MGSGQIGSLFSQLLGRRMINRSGIRVDAVRPASSKLDPIGIGEVLPGAPGRIRSIRERRFKYAPYVDSEGRHPDQHEMYDLDTDPLELENLAHPDHPRQDEPTVAAERERLAARLAQLT